MFDKVSVQTVETDAPAVDAPAVDAPAVDAVETDAPAVDTVETDADTVETDADKGSETDADQANTYADFDLGEGIQLDEAALALAIPVFQEAGLNQEQAQKLVGIYSEQIQAGVQKQVDAFTNQISEWQKAAKNDSEYGGDKFDENIKLAQSAVNNFGSPELKQLLEDYGIGNHPEMVRFMVKVGKTTAEDVPGSIGGASTKNDVVSLLYPNDRNS